MIAIIFPPVPSMRGRSAAGGKERERGGKLEIWVRKKGVSSLSRVFRI